MYYEEYMKIHKEIKETKGFWEDYRMHKLEDTETFRNYYKPKIREYFMKKGDIERMSLNYPIQGSSADITKLAGIYFFRYLRENNLLFKVLLPNVVHDEWLVECPEDIAEETSAVLKNCMEKAGNVFCKVVKLKADPVITHKWEH